MMYTLSSVQGSFEALRSINTVTHFTHFTVAHAHLGLYGFFSLVMFGAIYFVMPRVMSWEWPYPKLIALHFRSEEHTSELQSLMRISYAVCCLKKKKQD